MSENFFYLFLEEMTVKKLFYYIYFFLSRISIDGWESKGLGFEPRRFQRQPLSPGCQKIRCYSQPKEHAFDE